MGSNTLHTLMLAGAYLLLFGMGELLYHFFQVKVEITRKFVHIGTGLLALLFPLMLDNHWWVLLLCTSFALILILSLWYGGLKSINAIDRRSVGSLAYPLAVYGCYLAYIHQHQQLIYYYLPIMVLAISDPMAALVGKKWPIGRYQIAGAHKTVLGSTVFFVSAFLIAALSWQYAHAVLPDSAKIFSFVLIAAISTGAEAVSRDGFDNLSIPLSVILGLYMMQWWTI